ncbi:MAG: NAD(P)-dependent oxidoreductase [Candidatus Symbiothrix sp.]|nr:NAD(P)-dependent oxidoreductase [Candidatus Symbiothrix sp.]
MKKILITGANGFIGSFLVEEALQTNWQTFAGIRRSSNLEYLQNPEIQLIDLNFPDKEKLKKQLAEHCNQYGKWDYIIHNAGLTKCVDHADFDHVNYLFTKNLIETLQETGMIPEKFLLMSSLGAHHPQMNTAYGRSKRKAEEFLESQSGFPYIILCPTGVYGPREKDYYLMLKTLQAGWNLSAGFQPQQLTFIYVKDLVKAVFSALESPLKNKKYTVAEGAVYSDAEYVAIAKEALGKKFTIPVRIPLFVLQIVSVIAEEISKITKKPSTLNRDKYQIMKERDWRCDITEIQRDLDFKAAYNLIHGMRETVDWYRSNNWL